MSFATLLALHKITVIISFVLFLVRAGWRMADSPMIKKTWVKILPHVNDTVLIAAGIGMLVVARLNPLENDWLIAKFIALIVYIGLGMVAIKRGETRTQRTLAFVGALAAFGYIAAVAITKQVIPF